VQELKQSLAGLVLQQMSRGQSCDARDLLTTALDILAQNGGVYISENLVLTRFPPYHSSGASIWFARSTSGALTSNSEVVVVARGEVRERERESVREAVILAQPTHRTVVAEGGRCVTPSDFSSPQGKT
jgi:hypothetical protein